MMVRMKIRYLDNTDPNLTQNGVYDVISLGNASGQVCTIMKNNGVMGNFQLQSATDWEVVSISSLGSEQIYP